MQIDTADVEQLNTTLCASLAALVCRERIIAHTEAMLTAGI
jgi:hypothetical protein